MIEHSAELVTVNLPACSSLLSEDGMSLISVLEELADRVERSLAPVLLVQTDDRHDLQEVFFRELKTGALRQELVQRLDRLLRLMHRISNGKSPWFYGAYGSCLGSHFALARSCQHFVCSVSTQALGMPEMEHGLAWSEMPTRFVKDPQKWIDFWFNYKVLSPLSAYRWGMIDAILEGRGWQKVAARYAQSQSGPPLAKGELKKYTSAKSLSGRINNFTETKNLWKKRGKGRPEDESRQQYLNRSIDIVLSESFLTWLGSGGEWQRHRGSEPIFTLPSQGDVFQFEDQNRGVFIDLDAGVPPTLPLFGILRTSPLVFFIGSDIHDLQRHLNIIWHRISSTFGTYEATESWRNVHWLCTESDGLSGPVIAFTEDDRFALRLRDKQWHWHRVLGNGREAGRGIYELIDSPQDQRLDVSSAIANGSIASLSLGFSLTYLVRSMFLAELIRCRDEGYDSFVGLLDKLNELGWGFVANQVEWQRFLVLRGQEPIGYQQLTKWEAQVIDAETLDWLVWKQLNPSDGGKAAKAMNWTWLELSRNFAILAWVATQLCQKRMPSERPEAIEQFVHECCGFPKEFGTISRYCANIGGPFTERYLAARWQITHSDENT